MMKKAQIEIIGLMIAVILILALIFFAAKYSTSKDTLNYKQEFVQAEMASNMLNALLSSTSRDCNNLSISELLQECSNELSSIRCAGSMGPCDYVKQEAMEIFGKTLAEWKVNYEFKAFKNEENPIISLGSKCGANKKSKLFPIPSNSGILFVKLDICG